MANGGKRTSDRIEGLPPAAAIRQMAMAMDDMAEQVRQARETQEQLRAELAESEQAQLKQWTTLLVLVVVATLGVISNLVARLV